MRKDLPITPARIEQFFRLQVKHLNVVEAANAVGVDPTDMMLAIQEGTPGHAIFLRFANAMYIRMELELLCRALKGVVARSKEETAAGGYLLFDDAQALRLLTAHRARQEKRALEVAKMTGAGAAALAHPLPAVSADALFAFMKDRIEKAEVARKGADTNPNPKNGSRGDAEARRAQRVQIPLPSIPKRRGSG
jgi:hypothetical protein